MGYQHLYRDGLIHCTQRVVTHFETKEIVVQLIIVVPNRYGLWKISVKLVLSLKIRSSRG